MVATVGITAGTMGAGCQRLGTNEYPFGDDGSSDTSAESEESGDENADGEEEGEEDDAGDDGGPNLDCDPTDPIATGCPDGQKCAALVVGGTRDTYRCVDDSPTLEMFEPCVHAPNSGLDGCPASSACVPSNSETLDGFCLPMCLADEDCDVGLCTEDPFTQLPVCADDCSPLEGLCPIPQLECLREQDHFVCAFPTEQDVGGQLDPCDGFVDSGCAEGFVCMQGAIIPSCESLTGFCCTAACDLSEGDSCDAPASCNPIEDNPPPGFEDIGACYVPS